MAKSPKKKITSKPDDPAASQPAPNRPGRPPGSPNHDYDVIQEIPPKCLKCGSTKRTRVPGSKIVERRIEGVTAGGEAYNLVRHVPKRCECGQRIIVRSYHLVDELPFEPPQPSKSEIPIDQVVEGALYQCWCEARGGYVAAELFRTERTGTLKWRTEDGVIARLSALLPKKRIDPSAAQLKSDSDYPARGRAK